jgi:tetraacyldisaccharide 4'-kinase
LKQLFLQIINIISIPFALLYGIIIWLRNKMYDLKFFSSTSFSLPVICVGNLSVGGTGKTPHIEYLIELLQQQYHVATLSRGYKRATRGFILANATSTAREIGDEPFQYKSKYPIINVSVGEDRMTAIPELLQRIPYIQSILLDDAFQHRTVIAGINILITDYNKMYTKDYILPFGTLRESRKASQRAHIIIVSKCPYQMTVVEKEKIKTELNVLPHQKLFFTCIGYKPIEKNNTVVTFENKKNTSVLLVTGIAKPESLNTYLQEQFKDVVSLAYRDHHYFNFDDLDEIKEVFGNINNKHKVIITTEKDQARLVLLQAKMDELELEILVQPIGVHFLFNEASMFNEQILNFMESYYPPIVEDENTIDFE